MNNIDEEYEQLVQHLHDCRREAESFKTSSRRLSPKTLELIVAGLCREAVNEDLKGRITEVLAEAADAGKSITPALHYSRRKFAKRKTRMNALRNPKGRTIASRRNG
ncbi:hypothetical protein RB195_015422 [Necator americanus]|uniref:Uncharacterized protein n=1 Tax=Necator americanus TaxID=51031 RepID=A0ABR1E4H6_NECAM